MLPIPWTSYGLVTADQLRPDLMGQLEQPFAVPLLMHDLVRQPASRRAAGALFHRLGGRILPGPAASARSGRPQQRDRLMAEALSRAVEQGRAFLISAGLPPLRPLLVPAPDAPSGFAPAPGADPFLARRALDALDGALMRWRGGDVPVQPGLNALQEAFVPAPPPPIALRNPRWIHADEEAEGQRPDHAFVQDALLLRADVQGLTDGARVVFDLYQGEGRAAQVVKALSGRVAGGVAEVAWSAADLRQHPEETLAVTFRAKAEDVETGPCPVPVRFIFGQCTLQGMPLPDKPFTIVEAESGEEVLQGETDEAGLILAPFGFSDRYDVHLSIPTR